MGLSTAEIGLVYGTIGTIGLTLGGILGGIAASAGGLKKWIWPMALAISLPDAVFIYLSSALPDNLWIVNICVFIEQFGYGFGFTAYMLYLIYYSDGEHKTAHYATITDGEIRLKQIPYDRKPQFEKAKEFISTDKMMRTEIQDFMFFFGDAKTSREPLE